MANTSPEETYVSCVAIHMCCQGRVGGKSGRAQLADRKQIKTNQLTDDMSGTRGWEREKRDQTTLEECVHVYTHTHTRSEREQN